ncbi:treacle protein [Oncorhynchus mykiss]|uniref:treacle protein n=1 Tax=Oncorhynchus mykiss TaxID=8022 RepID=UPI001877A7D2|nr:treacle protein [Oncorhynchus mykiss]
MKPDGVAMEPTEAVGAEPSAQGMATDEMPAQPAPSTSPSSPSQPEDNQNSAAPPENPTAPPENPTAPPENPTAPPASKEVNGANGKAAADPKPKAKTVGLAKPRPGTAGTKTVTGPASGPSTSRPGTAPSHMANGLKSSASDLAKKAALDKKRISTIAGAPAAATKRSVASTVRTQTKVAVRVPRSTSATRPTNATWTAATGLGTPTRRPPAAGPINGAGARPKTTASRHAAPKPPSTSAAAKPDRTLVSKTTRPAAGHTGLLMGTSKPAASGSSRPAASRVGTTAPSTGRTTTAQAPKPTGPAKKDVSRPATTTTARKPVTSTTTKTTKPDPPKATAASRPEPASKRPHPTKAADTKPARPTSQDPKPLLTRKAPPTTRPPATRQPQGKTPPASPSNKPVGSTAPQLVKRASKPTQSVLPFTARPGAPKSAAAVAATAAAAVATVTMIATAEPEVAASEIPAPVSASLPAVALESREEVSDPTPQDTTSPSLPQSPLRLAPAPPQDSLVTVAQEERSEQPETVPADPPQPAPDQTLHQDIPAAVARATPSPLDSSEKAQLNMDEEEDEEREGSQRVSVSEMSGSQPTEESRPGSAGPAGSGWRAGGALLSELDSELSCSQQGASELSAPGVLEGTESMDDLGDASLKGAIDMEGMSASAGSPDFEKVPDIPTNDFDDNDEDGDRVCDMEVGSEWADDPRRARRDEDEDDDVEMASEGVTESGLESYGNADEDDFAEDERLDNLNQALPALAAQWDQPNPNSFCDPWAQPHPQAASASPLQTPTSPSDPWQADMETPTQYSTQPWLQLAATPFVPALHEPLHQPAPASPLEKETLAPLHSLSPIAASGRGMSHSSTLSATELAVHCNSETSTSTPEELCDYNSSSGVESRSEGGKLHTLPAALAPVRSLQPELEDLGIHLEREDWEVAETLPANEVPGDPATAPTSNPSSSSTTEDEASDTEGEAQLDELGQGIHNATFDRKPGAQRCLSALEEGEETSGGAEEGGDTPQSVNSVASYAYDMTASNSSNHSTAESCAKSPGIFSLEELPEEAKELELTLPPPQQQAASADSLLVSNPEEQQYMLCGTLETELGDTGDLKPLDPALFEAPQQPGEGPRVTQPPYYSTVCENTENSLTGLNVLPQPHCRRDHHPNPHCDLLTPPRLTCADLPPRSPRLQASPQLRRLERHQQQLLELQQRREQQGKPKEEEARKNSEKEMKKKEAEQQQEEEEKLRREELKQRQQIMRWQQELEEQAQQTSPQQQPQKGQATVLLSPSSGLHTIYEALESDEEGKQIEVNVQLEQCEEAPLDNEVDSNRDCREVLDEDRADSNSTSTLSPSPDSPEQEESRDASPPSVSPECPPPLDLDWGTKVDIVQQLINQTLLLTGDGCSSLLLLPGGTLSPLEASLWPKLLPPLTPPSATVTSVSSFSPEAPGQSPQGEWTVVELETHH